MRSVAQNFLFLAAIFLVLYASNIVKESYGTVTTDERALNPDILLGNSRLYAKEHSNERSLSHLTKALEAIRSIEEEVDKESQKSIEEAIRPLAKVIDELSSDDLDIDDMNTAYTAALNGLTVAELRISEQLILLNKNDEAALALKYAQLHIKNALDYALDNDYNMEMTIYAEIDSLIGNTTLSPTEIIEQMDKVIFELDSLVQSEIRSVE